MKIKGTHFKRTYDRDVIMRDVRHIHKEKQYGHTYGTFIPCDNIVINGVEIPKSTALKIYGNVILAGNPKTEKLSLRKKNGWEVDKDIEITVFDEENITGRLPETKYAEKYNIEGDTLQRLKFDQRIGTTEEYDRYIFIFE